MPSSRVAAATVRSPHSTLVGRLASNGIVPVASRRDEPSAPTQYFNRLPSTREHGKPVAGQRRRAERARRPDAVHDIRIAAIPGVRSGPSRLVGLSVLLSSVPANQSLTTCNSPAFLLPPASMPRVQSLTVPYRPQPMKGLPLPVRHSSSSVLLSVIALFLAAATRLPAQTTRDEQLSRSTVQQPAAVRQLQSNTETLQPTGRTATAFIENRGQWDARARFLLQTPGLNTWITGSGVVYDLYRFNDRPTADQHGAVLDSRGPAHQGTRSGQVVRMRFRTDRPTPHTAGRDVLPGVCNYWSPLNRA